MEIEAVDESNVSFSDSDVSTNRLLHERSELPMLIYQVLHTHLQLYFINEIQFYVSNMVLRQFSFSRD